MADKDVRVREGRDERVYPGAPERLGDGEASTGGIAHDPMRFQGAARAILAISLILVVGSGAFFALRPNPEGAVRSRGSAAVHAGADGSDLTGVPDPADKAKGSVGDARDDDSSQVDGPGGESADSSAGSGPTGAQTSGNPDSGSSDGSGSDASGQGPTAQEPESPQVPATISVRVTVDSSAVGGSVSANATVELSPSATAYDALCATGLSVDARGSAFGTYVAGIGGLAEFDHGGGSGWKYKVNGGFPNQSASTYELSDGDSVVWVYVTG